MTMLNRWIFRRASGLLLFLGAGLAFHSIAMARPPVCDPKPTLTEHLMPGQAVTRRIWDRNLHFSFNGKADEVITLRVTSRTSGLDPHVSLLDPEEVEEASDDDGGEHGSSLIKEHTLKRTGVYTILVGSDGRLQGKVKILLEKAPSR
jgi:hypothetical protein